MLLWLELYKWLSIDLCIFSSDDGGVGVLCYGDITGNLSRQCNGFDWACIINEAMTAL